MGLPGVVPWRVNDDDPKADGEAMKMDILSEARQAAELDKEAMAQARETTSASSQLSVQEEM